MRAPARMQASLPGVPGEGGDGAATPPGFLGNTLPPRNENATYWPPPRVVLVLTPGGILRLDFGRFPSWRFRMPLKAGKGPSEDDAFGGLKGGGRL